MIELTAKFHLSDLPVQLVESMGKGDLIELIVGIQKIFPDHSYPREGMNLEIQLIRHFKAIEQEIILDHINSQLAPPDMTPLKINNP